MQQIHQQRIAADGVQQGELSPGEELFVPALCAGDAVEEETCDEQEYPRNQGKVVCGVKGGTGKTQIRGQIIAIEPFRQGAKHQLFKAKCSSGAVSQQQKQAEATCRSDTGGDLLQQLFQRCHQQHAAANAGEDLILSISQAFEISPSRNPVSEAITMRGT